MIRKFVKLFDGKLTKTCGPVQEKIGLLLYRNWNFSIFVRQNEYENHDSRKTCPDSFYGPDQSGRCQSVRL